MKTLQKITLFIALVALIASCQSNTDVNKIFSNPDTKKAIIDKIANDSNLSKEMVETMMNSNNGKMMMLGNDKMTMMMMMENHGKMMKDDPGMMKRMMSDMMETCKSDTAMLSSMCKNMMQSPQMMDMMHKNMGGKMDMKGMKKMEGMDHKTKLIQ
ncbi:MAG: membrane or secreted protein [Bacteroidota bacterium]